MPTEELSKRLSQMTPAQLAELDRHLLSLNPSKWVPLPGPQTAAYQSQADELFYGGAAGGGKTGLIVGLSVTSHQQTIIFRREFPQLREVIQQIRALIGTRGYNSQSHAWQLDDHRMIELQSVQHEWDVEKYQGRPHDLICFDELPQFLRSQYRFLIGWNRHSDPKQRCRVVCTGNPPTSVEGRWVIEEWGPWLDDRCPCPAKPGELRWYTTLDDQLVWLDGPEPFVHKGERIVPRSRTFIPAKLKDNPILDGTSYRATLQALPEPLRSQMLNGDFRASMEDDPWQVIPTKWIEAAQDRWTEEPPANEVLAALAVDVARGGRDKTTIAKRYGTWIGRLKKYPGRQTPDGPTVAGLVMQEHNGQADVFVDVIGIGASAYDSLKDRPVIGPLTIPVNNSEACDMHDRSGKYRLVNVRTASYWSLREALDPEHGENVALPPDPELLADLTAPRFKLITGGIQVEPKPDIIKRLGRSPDCGDAVAELFCPHATATAWWKSNHAPRPNARPKPDLFTMPQDAEATDIMSMQF